MNSSIMTFAVSTIVTSLFLYQPALSNSFVQKTKTLNTEDQEITDFSVFESYTIQQSKGNYLLGLSSLETNIIGGDSYLAQSSQGIVEGFARVPSDYKPALRVCAQSTSNAYLMTCVDSPESQTAFSMPLDPGEYYFFSYLNEGKGVFFFHTIGNARAEASKAPKAVSVVAGQTVRNIVINESFTCDQYPQYCIAPPSSTAANTSSLAPSVRPGVYNRVSNFVVIYQYGNRFCYGGGSRNGTLTASISENSDRPNTYFFDASGSGESEIFQVDANTLHYGGGEYDWYGEVPALLEEMQPSVQACLTSETGYYEFEEPGARQRPRQ